MISEIPNLQQILSGEELATYQMLTGKINVAISKSTVNLCKFIEDYSKYVKNFASTKYIESIELSLRYLTECLGGETQISKISISDASDVLSYLSLKAPKGYYVYCRNLKAAFNWGVEFDYLKKNVFTQIKLPKKQNDLPSYLTKDQLNSVVLNTNNEVYKTIFQFAFYTGCRLGEIHNLKWNSINFNQRTITIGDSFYQTKSRKQRVLPMCNTIYSILRDYSKNRTEAMKTNNYVFTKSNGFRYYRDTASKNFKKVIKEMGLDENLTFHSLRHSFASFLVKEKRSLYEVQNLLGHSSIRTTEIYAHMNQDTLKDAVSVLD